jgi:hypothetical protein
MKSILITVLLAFFGSFAIAQTILYEHPQVEQYVSKHNKVAILPFKTSITLRPKDMKSMTNEQFSKMEEDEGYSIQSAMHSWFLRRKMNGKLKVSFLDPLTTNAKLRKMGVGFENIQDYTPDELADILEVDAIIMGSFETNKPMSEGASVALGLLVGFYGITNKAVLNMSIYDSEEGVQITNYNKAISGTLGSSTEDLMNILMRKASRRISYTD